VSLHLLLTSKDFDKLDALARERPLLAAGSDSGSGRTLDDGPKVKTGSPALHVASDPLSVSQRLPRRRCSRAIVARPTCRRLLTEALLPTPPPPGIREVLLELVYEMEAKREGGSMQQNTLLNAARDRLGMLYDHHPWDTVVLTQWHELFRTGVLAWGFNLNNPNPPHFHLTETGLRALANATRDPSNPAGYLQHIQTRGRLDPIALSYITEGLECYVVGLYKAAGVMVGVAAEAVVLELRDVVVDQMTQRQLPVAGDLNSWKVLTVTRALGRVFDTHLKPKTQHELWERYDANWSAFAGQIRMVRNDAGHPTSIAPVTEDAVHASLLIFPELCGLVDALRSWVTQGMA
jgi:hypothetical protein